VDHGEEAWLLKSEERGNDATILDSRHHDGRAWTAGNLARPLAHGAVYFAELLREIESLGPGDLLLFTDWRGDPDEPLGTDGSQVGQTLCRAARRGVVVKGLVWRSHLDRLQFSQRENRHLGQEIEAAGGECLLDMRVRPGGSHHQKFVVLRHRDRPDLDVAYVGGIDLCHSRNDDADHHGDPNPQPMAAVYGPRPPWHDLQLEIRGPAVGDVEAIFRERWNDPAPLTRNPVHRIADVLRRDDTRPDPLPEQWPDPPACGPHIVQLLRTYPYRRRGYSFAPAGERSIARGYRKAIDQARSLIYLEDQYLWSREVIATFADALERSPSLHLIAVIPRFPDQDGRMSLPPNLIGRAQALELLYEASGDRVAVYSIENHAGTPVYVHAKCCVLDDVWASIGSDNLNLRSWTHDSELSCAVLDTTLDVREPKALPSGHHPRAYARDLRLSLAREHLDRPPGADDDLCDPVTAFHAFADAAAALDAWYDGGRTGPRPPGRLRGYVLPTLSPRTRRWAGPLYRTIYDPDGRRRSMRRAHAF